LNKHFRIERQKTKKRDRRNLFLGMKLLPSLSMINQKWGRSKAGAKPVSKAVQSINQGLGAKTVNVPEGPAKEGRESQPKDCAHVPVQRRGKGAVLQAVNCFVHHPQNHALLDVFLAQRGLLFSYFRVW